tara:strand:- start:913 stop:1395 length:483 start_codon:yes stop_codon:yes gene_type:complete
MRSHRLLKDVFKGKSVQHVAEQMNLSPSTVYKWAESPDSGSASGIPNPLDRVVALISAADDPRLIRWLCEQSNGFYVENTNSETNGSPAQRLAPATSIVVKKFADLLSTVAEAAADSKINPNEAQNIRQEWEKLKRAAEGYVKCCEEGNFKKLSRDLKKD